MDNVKKLRLLKEVIQIDSTNGNEAEVATYIERVLAEYGIESQQIVYAPGRNNLVAEIGSGERVLGLSGHMDVVSAGDLSQWQFPPFSGTEDQGRIYGRGATDMKSGLMAMVIAMIELSEEASLLNGRVKLLATVGEEIGLLGAKQLTDEGYADGLSGLIVGEPTRYHIVHAQMGGLTYSVTAKGKPAHSSEPHAGINAIDNLIRYYNLLQKRLQDTTRSNPVLGSYIHNTSIIGGGEQINTVPGSALLQGNFRTIPEFDNQAITAMLVDIAEELQAQDERFVYEVVIDLSVSPMISGKDSDLVTVSNQVALELLGRELPVIGIPGGTDGAEFVKSATDFPIIVLGPGNETIHQVDEYVAIDNYLEMIEVYKEIARRF